MMKFVAFGTYTRHGVQNREERGRRAKEKAESLGLKIVALVFTTGPYDLVEILEAPSEAAVIAQAMWFKKEGYGELHVMRAYDGETMAEADALA